MKVINSDVSILEQKPGIEGMFKHIERIGRLSHKSENRIKDETYIDFISLMKKLGHYAVFDMGTVYLSVPFFHFKTIFKLLKHYPYTKAIISGFNLNITTTYRVILQENLESEMEKYWKDPTPHSHYWRLTSKWICSRFVANQIIRHASLRPIQESMRYCNYANSKLGGEITYIIPSWAMDILGDDNKLQGQEAWDKIISMSGAAKLRDLGWKLSENEYLKEINEFKMKPEDARGCLPHDTKTELYLCGYKQDWYKKTDTQEKTGFFTLRSDSSTQKDTRILSRKLEELFYAKNYDELL